VFFVFHSTASPGIFLLSANGNSIEYHFKTLNKKILRIAEHSACAAAHPKFGTYRKALWNLGAHSAGQTHENHFYDWIASPTVSRFAQNLTARNDTIYTAGGRHCEALKENAKRFPKRRSNPAPEKDITVGKKLHFLYVFSDLAMSILFMRLS
jgi:hypothetical protein